MQFQLPCPGAAAMLFPWPRTLERPTELRTQACAPIVSTPVRSNPTAVRRFFSANSLPAIRSFPNIRGFPFSPAKATGRRRPAAEPSLSLAATLRVPRARVCQSANSRLAPQLCTLQRFDPGSSDQMRQSKAVPSSPAGPDDAGIFVDDQNFRGTRRAATCGRGAKKSRASLRRPASQTDKKWKISGARAS